MKSVTHALCFLAILAICGCGPTNPSTTPVTGTVTYNGSPVEGATVAFTPTSDAGHVATGVTDSAGKFALTTFEKGDGAVVGSYTVAISKTETTGGMTADEEHEAVNAGQEVKEAETIQYLPAKYSNAATSGLTAEFTEGGSNDFTFPLTDAASES
jgi:hypothetical protein